MLVNIMGTGLDDIRGKYVTWLHIEIFTKFIELH